MPKPVNPKAEIRKLGSGEPVDCELLWEQMADDSLDRMLAVLSKPVDRPAGEQQSAK